MKSLVVVFERNESYLQSNWQQRQKICHRLSVGHTTTFVRHLFAGAWCLCQTMEPKSLSVFDLTKGSKFSRLRPQFLRDSGLKWCGITARFSGNAKPSCMFSSLKLLFESWCGDIIEYLSKKIFGLQSSEVLERLKSALGENASIYLLHCRLMLELLLLYFCDFVFDYLETKCRK